MPVDVIVMHAIILPSPLQKRLEAAAANFIHPPSGPEIDFSLPHGESALLAPDSVSWQVFKNPLSLFIGGVAAVILELAEPRVRTGVWNHTTFRTAPLPRMQRTGLAAMMTVYGPRSRTEEMIARIRATHRRIKGKTPDGHAYRADDPELLAWVHATASFGFLRAYHTYVCDLRDDQQDRFYAEGALSARLYGATDAPVSRDALDRLFETMRGRLEPSTIMIEFLDIMRHAAILPRPLDSFQALLVKAAVGIVPEWVRARLGITSGWELHRWQWHAIRRAGALADRIVLRSGPAVQSCRRLGLPDTYLYASR
jgi:uncharacterized protein (DUF2236 family)